MTFGNIQQKTGGKVTLLLWSTLYNHCARQTTEKLVAKQKTRRGVSVQGL